MKTDVSYYEYLHTKVQIRAPVMVISSIKHLRFPTSLTLVEKKYIPRTELL